jgi:phosphofructokinase
MQTQRIGVLTSGGDCPGLNAVLQGVTKAAEKLRWQVIGFQDGFEGLLPASRKFGAMVSYQNYEISDAPIADAVNCLRLVAPDHQLVKTAPEVGISFGDVEAEVEIAETAYSLT